MFYFIFQTKCSWVWPTFWKGYRKDLDVEDVCKPLESDESGRLGDMLETVRLLIPRHWKAQCEKAKPSLLKALRNMFWKQYLCVGLLDAFNTICVRLGQSLFLQQLLPFFALGSNMPVDHAMYYSGGIVGCTLLNVILTNHTIYWCMHLGLKMRIACSALIFRKAMRLSRTALGESASGQVVNLLSNDVSRFDLMSVLLNHLWIDPTLTVVVTYLMYTNVGWAAFVGVGTIFIIVSLLSYISSLSSKFRLMVALRTDERIRLMDEIVNGVQVIKMYAWEKPFMALISNTRRKEIRKLLNIGMVRGFYMGSMMITTRLALFATLITYVLQGSHLQASFVFVIQSYNILINTMAGYFTRAVSEVSESYISIGRLQKFLEYEEYNAQGVKMLTSDPSPEDKSAKAMEADGDVALTSCIPR
ncbi:hypothetical protein ONE63_011321 [Megalurothrips usitatus]|uniref:ABC transmembrane type-1 domain-containing protein n=1 Tax=Megalurothrips usitatus TaxID=439358 RepID=A0AAV7X2U5_9NEOP|nr:hypothetical protein ONE63_011321 [Megalurothrips usitatus]